METKVKLPWAEQWLGSPKHHYIGGAWTPGEEGREFVSLNPFNQSELCRFGVASSSDVERAAREAKKAFQTGVWRRQNKRQMANALRKIGAVVRDHAVELATLESLANGKLFRESLEDDLPDSADVFDYYAGWIDKHYGEQIPVADGFVNYTVREPVGVCGLIVPWNFPLLLACWKIAPALATGNSIIVKPSEYTSLTLIRFFELVHEHVDLPAGVLNMVLGDAETGEAIARSSLIDKVSFTGSTAVGKKIVGSSAQSNLKRVTLELGGKSPAIIFADAPDLEFAIDRTFDVMFAQKGEKCTEPTKFLVEQKVYDKVVSRVVERANQIKCGDPFGADVQQGPQCNEAQFRKIMSYIDDGASAGRLVAGGKRDVSPGNEKGWFIRPTVYADVDNTSRLAREEIFGPVLVITPFNTEDEAVSLANDTIYGLAAGLYTSDVSRAHRVAERIDAGMVFINRYGCYDFASPFGGFKQSGWGKEMGIHSLESYTRTKSIWLKV